jgi:BirA family biotin operon repressor/biotin-[acetyl-CoA-carboxylase] ligase
VDSGPASDASPLTADVVRRAVAGVFPGGLGRVEVVGRTGSTSTDLVAGALSDADAWPDRSVLVADHQMAGRGRSGRTWETPAGQALTFSVLLRPGVPVERFGWLSLLAGLAVTRAIDALGATVRLKWPNDVLVADAGEPIAGWGRRRKVAGVLGEVVVGQAGGPMAVVGIGVNVHQRVMPVPTATSLASCGVRAERVGLMVAVLGWLVGLDDRWRAAGGDAVAAGLADECAAACETLGASVRVVMPGGGVLEGLASGLSGDGGLLVVDAAGREHVVLAGDVERVR